MSALGDIFNRVRQDKIRTIPEKARLVRMAETEGRLLAVRGRFDYVEKVLPYCYAGTRQAIDPGGAPPDLHAFDVVFVGCPGQLPLDAWSKPLLGFLEDGGVLLTTDWCLENLLEKLFPKTLRKAGTAQGSFPLRVRLPGHPLVSDLPDCAGTAWVVESASHRIEVLAPKQVEVILDAPQMGEPSAVLVAFPVGKGLVVHAISHFHLQGSDAKGEYISAYLLTNVIDEAMRRRCPAGGSRIRLTARNSPAAPARIKVLN